MYDEEYKVMQPLYGKRLWQVIEALEECNASGLKVAMKINGVWLYSDTVNKDSAYLQVTGMTFEEFKSRFGS